MSQTFKMPPAPHSHQSVNSHYRLNSTYYTLMDYDTYTKETAVFADECADNPDRCYKSTANPHQYITKGPVVFHAHVEGETTVDVIAPSETLVTFPSVNQEIDFGGDTPKHIETGIVGRRIKGEVQLILCPQSKTFECQYETHLVLSDKNLFVTREAARKYRPPQDINSL